MTRQKGSNWLAVWLIAMAALCCQSAVSETIQMGLGYDRAHNGHGFDLHRAGNTYILYFYTYNDAGAPEWFVGIADMDGGVIAGDLLRFTYDDAAPAGQASILDSGFDGSFSLDFNNPLVSPGCNDGTDRSGAQQLAAFFWQPSMDVIASLRYAPISGPEQFLQRVEAESPRGSRDPVFQATDIAERSVNVPLKRKR